jgi:hypothetical protein
VKGEAPLEEHAQRTACSTNGLSASFAAAEGALLSLSSKHPVSSPAHKDFLRPAANTTEDDHQAKERELLHITYEIMHMDRCAARIDTVGQAEVLFPSFMPYVLWLESGDDLDTRIRNLENFHHWCASRMLTLDREHAKAILNSAGLSQAVTDKARAQVALSYRCLSLTDAFWVRQKGDKTRYSEVNLYENRFSNVLASKMGWYTMIHTEIGTRTQNEDGSYSYPMTVVIENTATKEEIKQATAYISGGGSGSIYGVAFFFAPAGGTVSDFHASNNQTIYDKTYNGHTLGYMPKFTLNAESSVTITYTVTTAPGVETPLTVSKTPTAQNSMEYFGVG